MPGDPVGNLAGPEASFSAEEMQELRAELGLDLPLGVQYARYWASLARLDLGFSYRYRMSVAALIGSRLGWTMLLLVPSLLIGTAAGAGLGAAAGWRAERPASRLANAAALTLSSMPPYFLALVLLYLLSFRLGLFPLKGYYAVPTAADTLRHLVLPVLVLSLFTAARDFTIMRGSVLAERKRPYVTFALSKGLRENQVLGRHVFRNASLPLVTMAAMDFGFIVGGALFVEIAFSMEGMGTLIWEAVKARDYPVLQGAFLCVSLMVMAANVLADLCYALIDPRVRTMR